LLLFLLFEKGVVWLALSVYYSNIRNEKEDLRCAQNAVKCDPENAEIQVRFGNALLEAKTPELAVVAYEKALLLMPEGAPERMTAHLGLAYCGLDKPEQVLFSRLCFLFFSWFKPKQKVMTNVRALRAIDLQYSAAAGLRFAAVSKELLSLFPEVNKEKKNVFSLVFNVR
jgi:tetratricopeptide (TPR) repeat protein